MKKIIVYLLLSVSVPCLANPYLSHPVLTPSSIKGELFVGAMKTNAGWSQETIAPIFYHNAAATDPWYKPSIAPLVLGWSSGGGSVSGGIGSILDVGPQIISAFEGAVGLFSPSGKENVEAFFNCSASATACGSLSAGAILNGTFQEGGKITKTWKEFGSHPVGYFIGPSVLFGGPKVAP